MKRQKVKDPVRARAVVAEMISRGGIVESFPPKMTDKDWVLVANRILSKLDFDSCIDRIVGHEEALIH